MREFELRALGLAGRLRWSSTRSSQRLDDFQLECTDNERAPWRGARRGSPVGCSNLSASFRGAGRRSSFVAPARLCFVASSKSEAILSMSSTFRTVLRIVGDQVQ